MIEQCCGTCIVWVEDACNEFAKLPDSEISGKCYWDENNPKNTRWDCCCEKYEKR